MCNKKQHFRDLANKHIIGGTSRKKGGTLVYPLVAAMRPTSGPFSRRAVAMEVARRLMV